MRYLIDTNTLSNGLLNESFKRDDIFVLKEIVEEYAFTDQEADKIKRSGIQILEVNKKHLQKLNDILKDHGDNFDLIRLYTNKGAGDVLMIAYILSEKERPEELFVDKYTIVTNDKELFNIARSYKINCISELK